MRGTKNGWTLLLLMLAGVVIGGFIGSIASSVPGLDWLNYGQAFGLENPLVLSMGPSRSRLPVLSALHWRSLSIAGSSYNKITEGMSEHQRRLSHMNKQFDCLPEEDRPYEKCIRYGVQALTNREPEDRSKGKTCS